LKESVWGVAVWEGRGYAGFLRILEGGIAFLYGRSCAARVPGG